MDTGAIYYVINIKVFVSGLSGKGHCIAFEKNAILTKKTCYKPFPFEEQALYSSPVFSFPLNIFNEVLISNLN